MLKIRKTYKFRLYPSNSQVQKFEQTLDLCRELYNAALQERRDAWRTNRVSITQSMQSAQLPELKLVRDDLNLVYAQVLQDVLKRVDRSFRNFFCRAKQKAQAGFPRFQGKSRFNSFTYKQAGFRITETSKLHLSKIGDVRLKLHRPVVGKVKTCTILRVGSKWFVCFCIEALAESLPKTDKFVGLDMGVENFATLSDGTQIENWKYYEASAKKLRVAQRRVARRVKGSVRRQEAVTILRSIHQKIFNQRHDFQHKLSTDLIRQYDFIAIEKLNILGMSKGILSKQIRDVSWGSFFQKLTYKAESAGRKLVEVDPRGTSQRCTCGETVRKDLSVRWHNCPKCGLSQHRDIVSAQIILSLGLSDHDIKWAVTPCLS